MNTAIIIVLWSLFVATDYINIQIEPARVNTIIHSEAVIENEQKLIIACTECTETTSKHYIVKIFEFNGPPDCEKVIPITRWGATIEVPSVVPKVPQTSKIQDSPKKGPMDAIYHLINYSSRNPRPPFFGGLNLYPKNLVHIFFTL